MVDETFERFDLTGTLERLRRSKLSLYLVGGAVRDQLLNPRSDPSDIDLMVGGDFDRATKALRHLGSPRVNRHGNLRYLLERGGHLDLIATHNFYGRARSVRPALHYFDASVNALAISLATDELIDPLGGRVHLEQGVLSLPDMRWAMSDPFEDVHVLLRVMRLVERTGLKILNPGLARGHRMIFDSVDWAGLQRLNGFGQVDAEARFAKIFDTSASPNTAWPEPSQALATVGRF